MRVRRINWITSLVFLVCVFAAAGVYSGTVFYDDFSDGDVTNDVPTTRDGIPVRWTPTDAPGIRDASSGDYVFEAVPDSGDWFSSGVLDVLLEDTSVRSQVRSTAPYGFANLVVRNQDPVIPQNYFGGIGYRPDYGGTILFLARRDSAEPSDYVFLENPVPLPFDIRNEDAMLQLDAVGNELKLWGWRVGDPMPETPQLVTQDATYASGFVRLTVGSGLNKDNTATFRFVHVADTHIPEPSTLLLCIIALGVVGGWWKWNRAA